MSESVEGPSLRNVASAFCRRAIKLSFARRKVCSTTNLALANAHHPSPGSLNFAREANDFGQHTGVLEEYQKSLALRHRLVRIDPTNAQWRYDEACILDQMGYEYRKAGLSHEAIAAYDVSTAIWRQLARTDPRHRKLDLSKSLGKLGDAKLAIGDTVGAIAAYEEGAVNWRRVLKRDPDNSSLRVNLAECLEKIGDVKFKAGDNTGALAAYEEVVAICRGLDEIDGSNTQRKWNLSLRLDRIGDVELALGYINAAACAYEESLALRRSLAEANTSNSRWQGGVSLSVKKISNLKHVDEERAANLAVQRELQDIDHLLFELDRVNAELQEKLSRGATEGKETTNVSTRSLASVEESLTISRRLAASDPTNAKYQCDVLADLAELADVKVRHGDPVEALSIYEESLGIGRRLADSDQKNEKVQRDDTPCAQNAALSLVPTESDDEGRRCAMAQGLLHLVLILKMVANARLNICDNSGARTALEESLAIARQLLEENKMSHVSAALHRLARALPNTSAFIGLQFEQYRNRTSALLAQISTKAPVAQKSQLAAKRVRLAISLVSRRYRNEPSALSDRISFKAWVAQKSQRTAKRVRLAITLIARRYRNEPSALLDRISAEARAAAQRSQRAAKTVRLAIRQISRGYRRQPSAFFRDVIE